MQGLTTMPSVLLWACAPDRPESGKQTQPIFDTFNGLRKDTGDSESMEPKRRNAVEVFSLHVYS